MGVLGHVARRGLDGAVLANRRLGGALVARRLGRRGAVLADRRLGRRRRAELALGPGRRALGTLWRHRGRALRTVVDNRRRRQALGALRGRAGLADLGRRAAAGGALVLPILFLLVALRNKGGIDGFPRVDRGGDTAAADDLDVNLGGQSVGAGDNLLAAVADVTADGRDDEVGWARWRGPFGRVASADFDDVVGGSPLLGRARGRESNAVGLGEGARDRGDNGRDRGHVRSGRRRGHEAGGERTMGQSQHKSQDREDPRGQSNVRTS